MNIFLKHKCTKNARLHFVECNPQNEKFYTDDGIELNERGTEVYASKLKLKVQNVSNPQLLKTYTNGREMEDMYSHIHQTLLCPFSIKPTQYEACQKTYWRGV